MFDPNSCEFGYELDANLSSCETPADGVLAKAHAYHFIGVGGIGMSGLAQICAARGHRVTGSDRSSDGAERVEFFRSLAAKGVQISAQDGSALVSAPDVVVVSTAIEDDNADLVAARRRGIPTVHRSEVLAHLLHTGRGIAVTGTSGKTTVTAMVGWMLEQAGLRPTIVNGGIMNNFAPDHVPGNTVVGGGELVCAEADESDGSVVRFEPEVGVVTSISKDHKEVHEILGLFERFVGQIGTAAIVNSDYAELRPLRDVAREFVTYGFCEDADIRVTAWAPSPMGGGFEAMGQPFELGVPGRHNVSNAAAAIAVGTTLGIPTDQMAAALSSFKGVRRRLEIAARVGGLVVIDDYAHNPEKIAAAISAVRPHCDRLVAVFQPHGFGPTKFMREELVGVFASHVRSGDVLFLLDIYYAGGTADQSISSADLVRDVCGHGVDARHMSDRGACVDEIASLAEGRTAVLVMGARDDTLTSFCEEIGRAAAERRSSS